jgi:hypothetical protein
MAIDLNGIVRRKLIRATTPGHKHPEMQTSVGLEVAPCRKNNQATHREPLPGTLIQGIENCARKPAFFARYKQNSGRGEGLIYNIPAAVFQITAGI